jgi:probable poly-beta-1,6-N-acetyl-D-glucosamine export protein
MVKRLLLLNGLAIVAVVLNHATDAGYRAMFHWANLYLPVQVPYWNPIGSFEYYILLVLKLLPVFSVPAFIFVAGFFTAYAAKGAQGNVGWSTIRSKIIHLLYPYLFWSLFIFVYDYALGTVYTPLQYLEKLFISGALTHYGFIPLLCYLYLLSPFLISFAKAHLRWFLFLSVVIQLAGVLIHYLNVFMIIDNQVVNALSFFTQAWLPNMWILYFALGILFGLYMQPFKQWLESSRKFLYIGWILATIWMLVDADLRFRVVMIESPRVYYQLITFVVYSILSIFCFLLISKIPLANTFSFLGSRTFAIYLIHWTLISITAIFLIRFAPGLLAFRFLLIPLFFTVGLGIPLVMMKIMALAPPKKYHRYIFG